MQLYDFEEDWLKDYFVDTHAGQEALSNDDLENAYEKWFSEKTDDELSEILSKIKKSYDEQQKTREEDLDASKGLY